MKMRILGFDGDAINTRKLAEHDLEVDDAELLFGSGEPDFFKHPTRRGRWIGLGLVPDGRFVLVVFTYDGPTAGSGW